MTRRRDARRTIRHLRDGEVEPEFASDSLQARLQPLRERLEPLKTRLTRLRARLQRRWYTVLTRLPRSPEPVRVVILAEERIGVARLLWLLNQRPDVRIDDVRFGPAKDADPLEQIENLRAALSVPARPSVRTRGVHFGVNKLLDLDGIRALLHEVRPLVVYVSHGNAVRAALFLEAKLTSKTWVRSWERTQYGKGDGATPPSFHRPKPFNRRTFTTRLRKVEIKQVRLRRFVDSLDLEVHRLSEEDLLRDERSALKDVLQFVGLEPTGIDHPPLVRADARYVGLHDDPEGLRSHLEDTPYLAMLDELHLGS